MGTARRRREHGLVRIVVELTPAQRENLHTIATIRKQTNRTVVIDLIECEYARKRKSIDAWVRSRRGEATPR